MAGDVKLGGLTVELRAKTSPFEKGLKQAQSKLSSFGGAAFSAAKKITMIGAAATGAAVAGLTALTVQSMKSIDEIAKAADRLGMATEGFTAYQHAANLAGVSQEQFTLAMEQFVRRNPGVAIEDFADKIAAIKDPTERAQAAYDAFGRSGMKMINLLQGGSAGLAAAREEADRLGISFSRLDAAKVEAANDAVTRLKTAFFALGNTIAIAVSPFVAKAANDLANYTGKANSTENAMESLRQKFVTTGVFIASFAQESAKGFVKLAESIGFVAHMVGIVANVATITMPMLNKGVKAIVGEIVDLNREIAQTSVDLGKADWAGALQNAANKAIDLSESINTTGASVKKGSEEWETFWENFESGTAIFDSFFKKVESGFEELKTTAGAIFDSVMTPLEKYEEKWNEIQKLAGYGLLSEETAIRAQAAALEDFEAATKTVDESLEKMKASAESIFQETRNPFEQYEEKIKEIQALSSKGLLSDDTASRAMQKAMDDLQSSAETYNEELQKTKDIESGRFQEIDGAAGIVRAGGGTTPGAIPGGMETPGAMGGEDSGGIIGLLREQVQLLRQQVTIAGRPAAAILAGAAPSNGGY